MKDKQIIIDGVDISGCERLIINKTYGHVCNCEEDTHLISSCKNRPNCYFKHLKRKEQECEQEKTLKEMYFTYYKAKHSDIKGEFFKLKAENWELKRELIQYEKDFKDLNYCAIKLKQALAEIKDICSEINCESLMQNSWCGNTDFKMGCCEKLLKKQILQLINEVEDDRQD